MSETAEEDIAEFVGEGMRRGMKRVGRGFVGEVEGQPAREAYIWEA